MSVKKTFKKRACVVGAAEAMHAISKKMREKKEEEGSDNGRCSNKGKTLFGKKKKEKTSCCASAKLVKLRGGRSRMAFVLSLPLSSLIAYR